MLGVEDFKAHMSKKKSAARITNEMQTNVYAVVDTWASLVANPIPPQRR